MSFSIHISFGDKSATQRTNTQGVLLEVYEKLYSFNIITWL